MKIPRRRPPPPPRGASRPRANVRGARPSGRQARRPGVPVRRRLAGRLPPIRRVISALAAVAAVAGLAVLVTGPWLRVAEARWEGAVYTDADALAGILESQRGRSVLAVDTRSLDERVERLPAVADAAVTASLTGNVTAKVVEHEAALIWQTRRARFLAADDGTIFAVIGVEGDVPPDLAGVPVVSDDRFSARVVTVGDRIPVALLEATMRVLAIDPAVLGSRANALSVRLDDEFGFRLVSDDPGWEIALGVYGTDPRESAAEAAARLERQVTAVRTLFAEEAEAGIGWVDVRNPGKVYFRAKG